MKAKPNKEFCIFMGCGAWNPELDRCGAEACPYPEDLYERWKELTNGPKNE